MSEPIADSLRTIHRRGVDAFAATGLASDIGPTVRRVARRRVGRAVGAGVVAVAIVATVTVGALGYSGHTVSPGGPSVTQPSVGSPVMVTVWPDDSDADIAHALEAAGVIASSQDFIDVAKSNDGASRAIQPGYYSLTTGMTPLDALLALVDPSNRVEARVTIPDGLTTSQTLTILSDQFGLSMDDLQAALDAPDRIGLPPEAQGNAEGWLGGDKYVFDPGPEAEAVLSSMITVTMARLYVAGVAPADYERVLTVASLIEKEAKLDVDRPKIARVIQNRLDAGMALELDSTVYYAAGVGTDGSVFTSDVDRQVDSPYNTYMVTGLPPGPIASPGAASIDAALHPADGPWLFFVTVNLVTGETLYATTFAEHVQNVAVLQAWMAANG